MGLFDNVFSVQQKVPETFSPAEAFAALTLAATASDGYLSDEKARGISCTLSRMKLFSSYPKDALERMFDKLLAILKQDGFGTLVDIACESLPQDLREAAFVVVADFVLADVVVTEEEQEFLKDLYRSLRISGDTAGKIVEVMLIKNRVSQ